MRHGREFQKIPIGIQNFEDLRNNDCVYVDKTELIYRLTHTNKVYFLSRPRRFGKSLLVSTLEAYFHGKKRTVSRLGYGDSGKGLDGLPGTTL